jgi:hypothetical protein
MNHYAALLYRHRPLQPNMLAVNLAIISEDKKLLLFKRRATCLGYSMECWSAGLEEHCNADYRRYVRENDMFPAAKITDKSIFDALRRTLKEELKLGRADIAGTEFRVLGFGFEFENFNTGVFGIAKVPLRAEKIFSNNAIKSGEEHDRFAYCPLTVPALLPVLKNKTAKPKNLTYLSATSDDNWEWESTARMRILLALYDEFGEEEVEQSRKRAAAKKAPFF